MSTLTDYRQWSTLKNSAVDRCTSDTQLQLHHVDADSVTCEAQQEQIHTAISQEEKGEQNSELMQPIQEAQNSFHSQNVEEDSPLESPKSIHSVHT